jgi:hypothetical protein
LKAGVPPELGRTPAFFVSKPVVIYLGMISDIPSNVIYIEFFDKTIFPKGAWLSEPDLCSWKHKLPCLAIRDMGMGIWKGFVSVDETHPYYGKSVDEILKIPSAMDAFLSVYGGLSGAGRLPTKYKDYAKSFWWIGIETTHGGDLMPLIRLEGSDADVAKLTSNQTYKDLRFIRRETNKLANLLYAIK